MKIAPPPKRLLFWAIGIPLLVVGWLVVSQAGMIYFPTPYTEGDLAAMRRDGLRRVDFETGQGEQAAFYKGPAEGLPEKVWLVFCGNGARAADYRDIAVRDDDGYFFIDYPGYGACSGKPGPKRIDQQVTTAVTALEKSLGDAGLRGRLCAFGHSIGAAVALRAAVILDIDELVIVSPFTSMKAMAELSVGKILSNVLLHRFDNMEALEELLAAHPDARVALFHGKADAIVPFAMGEELAKRFPENITFTPVPGNGHNDIVGRQIRPITAAMGR